jgi:hypothetical protein
MAVTVSATCPPSGAPDTERLFTLGRGILRAVPGTGGQATQTMRQLHLPVLPHHQHLSRGAEGMVYFADSYAAS